jgi:hypothetical protein
MSKRLALGQAYTGRRPDVVVINTSIEADANTILRRHCPYGTKTVGKFLSRLLYEFDAMDKGRNHERQRLADAIAKVVKEA